LTDRFGIVRTPTAVIQRLKRRGRSQWVEAISLRDVERVFGVGHRTIVRDWIRGDCSLPSDDQAGVPHLGWSFDRTEIEAFIKAHVYVLNPSRMLPGHPFTNLTLLVDRAQAWRSSSQLASYAGVSTGHVRRAAKFGRIPCRRRPGAGRFGELRFQARDFPSLRDALQHSDTR
jgi:hypothetical protein